MTVGGARNSFRGSGPEINPDETPRITPPHWAPPLSKKAISALKAFAILIALSACADKPAPLDNAFCRLFVRMPDPSDAIHLKKRENKVAILTNEQTFLHECSHNGGGLTPGPR